MPCRWESSDHDKPGTAAPQAAQILVEYARHDLDGIKVSGWRGCDEVYPKALAADGAFMEDP